MSPNSGLIFNSSLIGSSVSGSIQWQGGRTILALVAQQYGTNVFLQGLGPDNVTWVNINSSSFSTNQFTEYALPRGNYRILSNTGSSIALWATLVTLPY